MEEEVGEEEEAPRAQVSDEQVTQSDGGGGAYLRLHQTDREL